MTRFAFSLTLLAGVMLMNAESTTAADDIRVYLGTYTQGDSEGIYTAMLDRKAGKLTQPVLAGKVDNPSFVALHPTKPLLYSVSEVRDPEGAIVAFTIDPKSGKLNQLNKQSTQGSGPCHLSVDKTGRVVVAANYGGGSICSYSLDKDGSLKEAASFFQHAGSSVDKNRQKGPHAHSANFDPGNEHVVVCDLGLDQVLVYKLDTDTGKLVPHDPPSTSVAGGSGPRHLAFHPSQQFAYACLEMSSEVRAFQYHPEYGVLYGIQTLSTLPADFTANNSTAETLVHPSGRFVYVSNRGHDSIAVFSVNQKTGELSLVEHTSTHGQTPRSFGIDPSGRYLLAANQQTDNVIVFRIDPKTGRLNETGSSIRVPSPVCVRFWR